MLLNYHEMTVGESSDSPAKKKQFAVICAVMAAAVSYVVMTSGVTMSVEPSIGEFPGGSYCYKLAYRDYAASMGLGRRIMMDATGSEKQLVGEEREKVEKNLHHIFLDSPTEISGRAMRWASGLLVNGGEKEFAKKLMALNTSGKTPKREPRIDEMDDLSAGEVMQMLPYQMASLPSVDSLILQFPHSHGFASALVLNYKIIPAMRKLAKEKGTTNPVVISTCRKKEDMCTIYAPLAKADTFHLGHAESDTYKKTLPDKPSPLSYRGFKQSIRKLAPFTRPFIDKYLP